MEKYEKKQGTSATRAKNRYNSKNYDRIAVVVPSGEKEKISQYAKEHGFKSTNDFIVTAIREKQEREKQ